MRLKIGKRCLNRENFGWVSEQAVQGLRLGTEFILFY